VAGENPESNVLFNSEMDIQNRNFCIQEWWRIVEQYLLTYRQE